MDKAAFDQQAANLKRLEEENVRLEEENVRLNEENVRLEEENERLKKEPKALKATATKHEATIESMNKTAERNHKSKSFHTNSLTLIKGKLELKSEKELNKGLMAKIAGFEALNNAAERQAHRDDANAVFDAAKQAKRDKVKANAYPSVMDTSTLSGVPFPLAGPGASSYAPHASSHQGMHAWPHQQQQH